MEFGSKVDVASCLVKRPDLREKIAEGTRQGLFSCETSAKAQWEQNQVGSALQVI